MGQIIEQATVLPAFPVAVFEAHKVLLADLGVSSIKRADLVSDGVTTTYLIVESGCSDWGLFHTTLQTMLTEAGFPYCFVEGCYRDTEMIPGQFGGFANFITAYENKHMGTGAWLSEKRDEYAKV